MRLFIYEETEAQRGKITYQISHSSGGKTRRPPLITETSQGPNSMAGRY